MQRNTFLKRLPFSTPFQTPGILDSRKQVLENTQNYYKNIRKSSKLNLKSSEKDLVKKINILD